MGSSARHYLEDIDNPRYLEKRKKENLELLQSWNQEIEDLTESLDDPKLEYILNSQLVIHAIEEHIRHIKSQKSTYIQTWRDIGTCPEEIC